MEASAIKTIGVVGAGIMGHGIAQEYLTPHLEPSTEPSSLLRQAVEEGRLGLKTGEGFYEWAPDSAEALRQRIANALVEIAKWDTDL